MEGLLDDSVAARRNGDERPIGGLPKIKDIIRRSRRDSDPQIEAPDLDFEYEDTDTLPHEIAELYSYSESPEFYLNRVKFLDQLEKKFPGANWTSLDHGQKVADIMTLLDQLEVVNASERMDAARSLLYLAHGNYSIGMKEDELLRISRKNLFLMLQCGVFQAVTQLLCLEMDNLERAMEAMHKGSISIVDNMEIRVCLSIHYIFIENLRREDPSDSGDEKRMREEFLKDLSTPIVDDDSLVSILFVMLLKFCSGNMPHYPIKKILVLIWKIILTTLGGMHALADRKKEMRIRAGLPGEYENPKSKPMSLTHPAFDPPTTIERKSRDELIYAIQEGGNATDVGSPSVESASGVIRPKANTKGLEFRPKVRMNDVEAFVENSRAKFSCFENADSSVDELTGLPDPIKESIEVLKAHVYTPLADIQIKEESQLEAGLAGKPVEDIVLPERTSEAEKLYKVLLPNLPQYMIALLKVLLAAAPTSKARSDSLNILVDVVPQEIPNSIVESTQLTLDINRHKEIIVKAISAILLLLLKHLKVNHIYQFEFISQHLVFANCIQLILKFFNQNTIQLLQYVTAKNNIYATDFTNCVLRSALEEDSDPLPPDPSYCWRNLFSCINLVRILQKLTKWKHSRTMMLVVFKSAPILKRALKVRHPMMQLYVLKLLKVQAKYLGRNWRRSNMKIISSIYQMVRHRLHDDWAYGNDLDARPWDFQTEEYALRACVDRFNARYYSTEGSVVSQSDDDLIKLDMTPVDVNPLSVLGQDVELSEDWKEHYEEWVDKEVIFDPPNWDHVLNHP
ncbi:striatin-interacting protein 1 homolog [Dysidea avara]|uniref:striatin-interacting protein 1 homolog n=1 Tax=Dysidea avara TaxID=196820 RepID=UPI003324B745